MISTTNKYGYYQKFSGTSGATPLVTGALAGFTWMSGYQPTGAEAKALLKKTAIPLRLSNEDPQMNGPGMLNAYKLGMVGKRLKEQCGEDIYCYKNKIQDSATYEFLEDTAKYFIPANKNYVTECQGSILCRGTCPCESQKTEYVFGSKSVMRAKCVNSQCQAVSEQIPATNQGTGQK